MTPVTSTVAVVTLASLFTHTSVLLPSRASAKTRNQHQATYTELDIRLGQALLPCETLKVASVCSRTVGDEVSVPDTDPAQPLISAMYPAVTERSAALTFHGSSEQDDPATVLPVCHTRLDKADVMWSPSWVFSRAL